MKISGLHERVTRRQSIGSEPLHTLTFYSKQMNTDFCVINVHCSEDPAVTVCPLFIQRLWRAIGSLIMKAYWYERAGGTGRNYVWRYTRSRARSRRGG